MPWVGSSKMKTSAPDPSHLARTTFCWLPPDRYRVGCSASATLIFSRSIRSRVDGALAPLARAPAAARRRGTGPCVGSVMFLRTEKPRTAPWCLRSSGSRQMPAAIASRGELIRTGSPRTKTAPDDGAVGAEDQPHQLGAPRADEPGDAEQLAGAQREARVLDDAGQRHALDAQQLAGRRAARRGGARFSGAIADPVICLMSAGLVDARRCRPSNTVLAVAHDRHAVGDLEDLVEPVRDVGDRDAVVAQARAAPCADGRSRRRSATPSARRARTGARPPPGRARSSPGGGAATLRLASGARGSMSASRRSSTVCAQRRSARRLTRPPAVVRVAEAEPDVLGDRQVRDVGKLLVDEREARARVASCGSCTRVGSPSTRISPVVGLHDAGEALDQRALAGAVLAEQADDAAAGEVTSAPSSATTPGYVLRRPRTSTCGCCRARSSCRRLAARAG